MNAQNNEALSLSPELAELLSKTPLSSDLDLGRLGKAVRELDDDPKWRAEFLKGRFVSNMLAAMHEESLNQASIANAWGKTRQYVSKLLNEDRRVNFTIETMCELTHLLHRHLDIQVLRNNEASCVIRCVPRTREVINPEAAFQEQRPSKPRAELLAVDFRKGDSTFIQAYSDDESCLTA